MASQLTSGFGPPPKVLDDSKYKVRRDVAETTQDVIPTSTSLPCHQDRSLHFKIDPAANKCINLSLMKLHLKYRVVDKNSLSPNGSDKTKVPKEYTTVIPGNEMASIFKDVKVKLNGVVVTETNDLYPWISKHLYLTKLAPVYRKSAEVSGRVFYDTEDLTQSDWFKNKADEKAGKKAGLKTDFTDAKWKDLLTRQARGNLGKKTCTDLCNYLATDLTTAPTPVIIPPEVTVEIELQPNDPSRTLIASHSGFDNEPKPVVEIQSAEIIVPRILPNGPTIPSAITHQFMAVSGQPIFIPKNSTNYHGIVTFPGPLPSRLSVAFVTQKSYDGNYASNMFNSQAFGVESISFNAGGSHFPSAPLTADMGSSQAANMYLRTAESLRFSLDKTGMQLASSIPVYKGQDFLYSADISSDYSADSTWTTRPDHGSVAINIHFAKPTTEDIVAIVISESVATLRIDNAQVSIQK